MCIESKCIIKQLKFLLDCLKSIVKTKRCLISEDTMKVLVKLASYVEIKGLMLLLEQIKEENFDSSLVKLNIEIVELNPMKTNLTFNTVRCINDFITGRLSILRERDSLLRERIQLLRKLIEAAKIESSRLKLECKCIRAPAA